MKAANSGCAICESPLAGTLHFGARSCKACAAFFRRTVSMNMTYKCVSSTPGGGPCRINHELRMICRCCRYQKCVEGGMKRELVQNRRQEFRLPKKRRADMDLSAHFRTVSPVHRLIKDEPPSTPESQANSIKTDEQDDVSTAMYGAASCSFNSPESISILAYNSETNSVLGSPLSSSSNESAQFSINSLIPRPAVRYPFEDAQDIMDRYVTNEKSLNVRRRIFYTPADINNMFEQDNECPYNLEHLRPCVIREFNGLSRTDLMMLFDYCRDFPGFDALPLADKQLVYRYATATDSVLGSAYYTMRVGLSAGVLVHVSGSFLPVDTLPKLGSPIDAPTSMSPEDQAKYNLFMPMRAHLYNELVLPMAQLQPTFVEYAALKALVVWHLCHYRLSPQGRTVCEAQQNYLVEAMQRHCKLNDPKRGEEHFGSLILLMSSIFEVTNLLVEGYVQINFFDIVNLDPLIKSMVAGFR
uniref:Nuclear receptor domain-containing protein n=1 Tax=Steinernema glaseri TaxID=37863 RepID=A0A1I8A5M9_9BILA